MSESWFCFCVLLASSWRWWSADGSCLYPGHRSNERVVVWPPDKNGSFSTGTIATYFCENQGLQDWFKKITCLENGTWIWAEGKSDHQQCALNTMNRCQRRHSGEIPTPLETIILDDICISLHDRVASGGKLNLETTCNTAQFRSIHSKRRGSAYYSIDERNLICNSFRGKIKQEKSLPMMLFLTRLEDSDETWLKDFRGSCPLMQCYLHSDPAIFTANGCDFKRNYWICRHEVSSCGIPSQRVNTKMNYSGIYVDAVADYQCYYGFTTKDKLTRRCFPNGLWEDRAPKCEPVNCGLPKLIENITVELTNGSTTLGSWVNYTCELPGYYINGSQYRTCQANGRWNGEEPYCMKTDSDAMCWNNLFGLNEEERDLLMEIVGIIAGVTFFLIALMWSLLAVLLYRDKRKQEIRSEE